MVDNARVGDGAVTRRWIAVPAAAKRCGVCAKTFRKWVAVFAVPVHHFGSVVRIDVAELEEWIEACRRNGHDE